MCTAAIYKTKDFYFGRNLDYEVSYGESVAVTPRKYKFVFTEAGECAEHYAMIGMAHVSGGYPLYYDAVNEKGLCMAGLNFAKSAVYHSSTDGKTGVAQYEFIPFILGQCDNVYSAKELLGRITVTGTEFGSFPTAKLHWMIADRDECIVVESTSDGLHVYDNPAGVMTNEPPFPIQLFSLNNYMNLSPLPPKNSFSKDIPLTEYSRGMGAIGLPGDLSSQSRFVRAAFVTANSVSGEGEEESVSQFFHILKSVEQQRGCCVLDGGKCEITLYSTCCNAERGIYYYTSYDNSTITGVDMGRENLDADEVVSYPMNDKPALFIKN